MIRSFWILYDEENDCYSVEIDNGICSINYGRAKVVFSDNGVMALPVSISVMNENMEVVNEYSLAPVKKTE